MSAAQRRTQQLEFVRLPLSYSCLIRPNIYASETQNIIEFETAFKTGQKKNLDGMSALCFPHPYIALYCKIDSRLFQSFVGKTIKQRK